MPSSLLHRQSLDEKIIFNVIFLFYHCWSELGQSIKSIRYQQLKSEIGCGVESGVESHQSLWKNNDPSLAAAEQIVGWIGVVVGGVSQIVLIYPHPATFPTFAQLFE